MLHRSLFASVLMLVSTVGFAGVASADTATVTFSGSIDGVCTFDNATASGSLATSSSYGNQYLFASQGYAGTEATLNVTCNTPGTVSIGQVTPSSSNPVGTIAQAGFGSYWNSSPISVSAGSTVPVQVSMIAYDQNGGQLPSGNYQYTVTVTAAGN
ncbi:MAG TPA: hypothetical protein VE944_14040 [Nostoc sp.]|uniref:hypothetical protein n=1 Tax=Nostoc sp. TaxID=1180 RepID=UPI002D43C6D2|nr:hypothetical protein [Nostoc sp.]HYX15459.1 hypothetical protein [Nostoc sp.]